MKILIVLFIVAVSSSAFAVTGSETWSLGLIGGLVTTDEADIKSLETRANQRVGGISTPTMANSYEVGAFLMRRLNQSSLALQLRPMYFWNNATGSGTGGAFNYTLSGYTIMPILRAYILESQSVKLYLQGGIGYGSLNGKIEEAGASVDFNANTFGYQGGLGVSFCFGAKDQHCVITEGNFRYMYFDRNVVSAKSGSFAAGSLSQTTPGLELELDGHDLATTMSGIQGIIGYQYNL
jgi:hypothetical protein